MKDSDKIKEPKNTVPAPEERGHNFWLISTRHDKGALTALNTINSNCGNIKEGYHWAHFYNSL